MDTKKFMVTLLKNAVDGTQTSLPEDVSFDELYKVSKMNNVDALCGYAIKSIKDNIPAEIWKAFEKSMFFSAMVDVRQDAEVVAVMDLLKQNEVPAILLKGYVLKKMYPVAHMRTMSDIDILIPPEKAQQAKDVLVARGYAVTYENVREFNAELKGMINIEIHLDMISATYKEYHEYYSDIWQKARVENGEYKLSDEDFIIYHVVHIMKHYISIGIGIRAFLDVYVFMREKGESLNYTYIDEELEKLGIKDFFYNVIAVSNMWFNGAEETEITKEMAEFILAGGVFGAQERVELYKEIEAGYKGKWHAIKASLFPDMHSMSAQYPILLKHKHLLVVFWVVRIFKKLTSKTRAGAINKVLRGDENADKIGKHLKNVGL